MKQILIDVRHGDVKVALTDDGRLEEFWIENRHADSKLVGNIYKGKVVNVLQGMQACFVDIGRERNAFLYAGDVVVDGSIIGQSGEDLPIKFPLQPGDIIMCQVLKEEFGNKGARLTMNISLPGRMLVMSPYSDYLCTSRKIEESERKALLEETVRGLKDDGVGYIIRTEANTSDVAEIKCDIDELNARWIEIKDSYLRAPVLSCIYTECDIVSRAIRDMLKNDIERVVVNDLSTINRIKQDFGYICGKRPDLLEHYQGAESMYHHYGIFPQIERLLKKKVELSNGAYLVIDRTEALTVIDVNTGKYVGEVNLEETVYVTNMIAAQEIARQIRLRNLSGIIIVDFIDMTNEKHKANVLSELGKYVKRDRIKCSVLGMTDLGLVQITRKKTRTMLTDELTMPCPYCKGEGNVFNEEMTVMRIRDYLVEIFKGNGHLTALKIFVSPAVSNKIFSSRYLEDECANDWADKRIYIIPDSHMHVEKFTVEKVTDKVIDLPDNARLLI